MPQHIVSKLFRSFEDLERSINLAKQTIACQEDTPLRIRERIAYYERVLTKQRQLASFLSYHMQMQNWAEVKRQVKMMGGLMSVVQEDARAFLVELLASSPPVNEERRAVGWE